jgi:hypothetical protein
MSASEGIVAGILAGIFMGIVSEIGYRLGALRSSLPIVDGSFAAKLLRIKLETGRMYALGAIVHLVTSAIFGIVYYALALALDFDPTSPGVITVYVAILWLSMLFMALPVAGQGFLGSKMGRFASLEQLVLHIVFGIGFWWALETI